MIRQVRGSIADLGINEITVEVGGIGYLIHTNIPTDTLKLGSQIILHTHLAVRENSQDLYGFLSRDELELFELLIELPKIGPKSALQFLIQADIPLLKEAVYKDDPVYLSKMSGIGKKSAEKIVIGLKDKFENDAFISASKTSGVSDTNHAIDTVDALLTLGYSEREARQAIQQVTADHPEVNKSNEALKLALKLLSK